MRAVMAAPLVKPQYGPSLPALLAPRVRALPRGAQRAVAVGAVLAAVAVLAALALIVVRHDASTRSAVVRKPVAFNLIWTGALVRTTPRGAELLRLTSQPGAANLQRFAAAPLRLPPYRGEPSGLLPLYAETVMLPKIRREFPGAVVRGEGKARINDLPGYQINFQGTLGGRVVYGRRVALLPDQTGAREGADLELLATRSPAVPRADAVGANGALKTPYRSFRLGTSRP